LCGEIWNRENQKLNPTGNNSQSATVCKFKQLYNRELVEFNKAKSLLF